VLVALGIQKAMHMRHIVIYGLSGSTIFSHIISKKYSAILEKGVIEHYICVLIFSKIFSAIFFIPRKTDRDIIKIIIGRHIKYPLFLS